MPRPKFPAVRDATSFALGVALLGHETLQVAEPRYLLIGVAVALLGLPATLTADRRFVASGSSTPAEPPPVEPGPAPGQDEAA